jgi:hypothetical protein
MLPWRTARRAPHQVDREPRDARDLKSSVVRRDDCITPITTLRQITQDDPCATQIPTESAGFRKIHGPALTESPHRVRPRHSRRVAVGFVSRSRIFICPMIEPGMTITGNAFRCACGGCPAARAAPAIRFRSVGYAESQHRGDADVARSDEFAAHQPLQHRRPDANVDQARALAARLKQLSSVSSVLTIDSLVPQEQTQKLALIADAADILAPTQFRRTPRCR